MLGTVLSLDLVWLASDTFNGLMAPPNLIALLLMAKVIVNETRDFKQKIKTANCRIIPRPSEPEHSDGPMYIKFVLKKVRGGENESACFRCWCGGVSSAWYLAEAGHEVTVIDRAEGVAMETSFANAGQLFTAIPRLGLHPVSQPKR